MIIRVTQIINLFLMMYKIDMINQVEFRAIIWVKTLL